MWVRGRYKDGTIDTCCKNYVEKKKGQCQAPMVWADVPGRDWGICTHPRVLCKK